MGGPRIWLLTIDKFQSNHTGDGQTEGKTRTEVLTVKIYEFLRSNVMTPGATELQALMLQVIINTF